MKRDLTAIEAIGLAVRSEEDAEVFYTKIASKMKNSLVKAKFEGLAREESGHKKILESLYRKMSGDVKLPPKIPGRPETAEGRGVPVDIENMEELFKFAITREQDASTFYKDAAAKTKDMSGRRTFEYLSDIEHGHAELLKSELKAYLRDKNWYSDNPDIQLVGP